MAVIALCQFNTVEMDLNLGNNTENHPLTQGNPMAEFNIGLTLQRFSLYCPVLLQAFNTTIASPSDCEQLPILTGIANLFIMKHSIAILYFFLDAYNCFGTGFSVGLKIIPSISVYVTLGNYFILHYWFTNLFKTFCLR